MFTSNDSNLSHTQRQDLRTLPRAEMTLPSVTSERLMLAPSVNLVLSTSSLARSLSNSKWLVRAVPKEQVEKISPTALLSKK